MYFWSFVLFRLHCLILLEYTVQMQETKYNVDLLQTPTNNTRSKQSVLIYKRQVQVILVCRCTCTVDNANALDGNGVSWVQCPVHFKVGTTAKYFSWSACMQFKFRYFQHQYRKKKNVNYSKNRVNVDKWFINEILLPPERSAMLQKNMRARIHSILYEFEFTEKSVPIIPQAHIHIAYISSPVCLLPMLLF